MKDIQEISVERDANIIIPSDKDVIIRYKSLFFEKYGLIKWIEEFKLGTAGYRDTMNMDNFYSLDVPFNAHSLMVVAEAMARIYDKRGYRSFHLGGEVRRYTKEIIELVSRIFASHGISVHLHADHETIPIWASSFGVFYNELDGGVNVTASHSQNFKQGFKPIDEKGMQLLDMADEIRDEVKVIGNEALENRFSIKLKALKTSEINKGFRYIDAYVEYIKDIMPKEALGMIREAQEKGMKVGVSTVGGSMHENSLSIFQKLKIGTGHDGIIQYMHWEKRDDFHGVGEIEGDNYGCDPTKQIIYRNIGIKERLLKGDIHFGFIWDPDGDRYNMISAADASMAQKAEDTGLEVERIDGNRKCIIYFKPNQIYFLDASVKLEMMAENGELFKYDWVIGTTYPTSKSIGELADVFNRKYADEFSKNGTQVRVFRTPVGFKYFGNMVGKIEAKLQRGGEVVLTETTGERVSLGFSPRILIMAEESGGAAMGGAGWTVSRNGKRKSLALKEKDAMQIAMMNLGIMSKLYLEGGTFAELYIDKIDAYDIRFRYYDRIDKKLFDESLTGKEREAAKAIGNNAKSYMVETFKSFTKIKPVDEVRNKLQNMTGDNIKIPEIKRVFWAGDGTYLDFDNLWFELRASGTDAVLRFYIEGKDNKLLNALNSAFVDIADAKIRELSA